MSTRDLKMQVLLDLRERVLKPLTAIRGSSAETSKEVKALRDRMKELNAQNERIESFRKVSTQAAIVGNNLRTAQDRVKALAQQMAQTAAPTAKMTKEFDAAKRAANELKNQHTELITRQQRLRTVLGESGIKTSELSSAQRGLKASITETSAALGQQETKLKAVNAKLQQQHAARAKYDKAITMRNKMAGAGTSLAIGGAVMSAPVVAAVRQYSDFEDAMLGVARQVEGARDSNGKLTKTYYEIGDEIKRLSQTIPLATTEIAAIVEAGARMGIQGKDNLLTFAKTTAMTAAAFDLPVDQIGEQMGKLSNLYKIPIKEISNLGDVINYLDDNALSKGGDIIDVMQRIAGTAATVNMGFKDAAALGSTFLSLGASAEIAATASNAMMRELAIATQQPKRFQAGLVALKLNAKEIQSSMSRDATGTIQRVLEAINKLPKEKQLSVTTQLFGKQYGDDAAKLANNLVEYRRQLDLVNASKARGSMARESDSRNDVLSSRYQMVKNRVFNQMSGLGETLRPSLVSVMTSLSGLLERLDGWTKKNPELTATLVKLAAASAIIVTVIGALILGAAAVLGPFAMLNFALTGLPIVSAIASGALGFLGTVIATITAFLLANPIVLLVMAIAAAAFLIYKYWEPISAFFSSIWNGISNIFKNNPILYLLAPFIGIPLLIVRNWDLVLAGLKAVWNAISPAASAFVDGLKWLFLNLTPLGWIIKNWDVIRPYFSVLWAGITSFFEGGISGIASRIINWSPLGLFYKAFAGVLSWFGLDLPKTFTGFGGMLIDGIINGITAGWGRLNQAVNAMGENIQTWFKAKLGIHSPSRVFAELGGHTMAGYNIGLQQSQQRPLDTILGFGKKVAAFGAGFAIAAPTLAGGSGLNHGFAGSDGTIIHSNDTIHITVQAAPGQSPDEIAQAVLRKLEERDRQRAARARARFTDRD